jgi:hypothetical protein
MYGDAFIMQASTHGGNDTLNGGSGGRNISRRRAYLHPISKPVGPASHVETTYELCDFSRRLVLGHDLRCSHTLRRLGGVT